MRISIPSSLLPQDTENLSMKVATYDPNNPEDAEFFPGEYQDSNGQKLVSVAFNFAAITTDTDEPVAQAMQRQRQQRLKSLKQKIGSANAEMLDEEPVIINRVIPIASCPILETMGDSDTTMADFQVPIYVYNPNSGLWVLIGQGTIFDDDGIQVSSNNTSFDCEVAIYTMEILVTSDIFLSQWWNLDYPILFEQPQQLCANIELRNEQQQILPGIFGLVTDKADTFTFSSSLFTTDDDGQARVCVTSTSTDVSTTAELYIYNVADLGFFTTSINLYDEDASHQTQVITIDRARKCYLEGDVKYPDNSSGKDHLMFAVGSNFFFSNFGNTDQQGHYSLPVSCDIEHKLYNYSAFLLSVLLGNTDDTLIKDVKIDGIKADTEQSDDGNLVVVNDFVIAYNQPYIFPLLQLTNNKLGVTAYALSEQFPIQVTITIRNQDGSIQYGKSSQQMVVNSKQDASDLWYLSISSQTFDFDIDTDNNQLFADIEMVDAKGKNWKINKVTISN